MHVCKCACVRSVHVQMQSTRLAMAEERKMCKHIFLSSGVFHRLYGLRIPGVLQELDASCWGAVANQARDLKSSQSFRCRNLEGWRNTCTCVIGCVPRSWSKITSSFLYCKCYKVLVKLLDEEWIMESEWENKFTVFTSFQSHVNKLEDLQKM